MPYLVFFFIASFPIVTSIVHAAEQEYTLGTSDVVTLVVYAGGESQLAADLTVGSDGNVIVPMLGPIKAKGLTLAQLEQTTSEPFNKDYFVNPKVLINVKEFHSLFFHITGAVEKPGRYEMDREPTLLELIGKAGGLKPEYAHTAYVMHEDGNAPKDEINISDAVEVDLLMLLDSGGGKGNLRLKSGDVVQIPFKTEMDLTRTNIFIDGEVKNPGMYPYRPGLTILNACVMAGGFNEFSAPNRAKIIRKKGEEKEVIKINLEDVKNGELDDIVLQPGDFINIPETWF